MTYLRFLPYIAVALLAWFVTYAICGWEKEAEMLAQKDQLSRAFSQANQTSEDVSNDYQKKLSAASIELNALRLRQPARCLPVTSPARRCDEAGNMESGAGNGLSSDWLYNYSGRCREVVVQLTACQDFVNRVWGKNGN